MSNWTDESVKDLKALVAKGFSAGKIVELLNAAGDCRAFTRNMVIGKARRLSIAFLPGKDRPQKPKSPQAPVKSAPKLVPIPESIAKLPQEGSAFVTPPRPIEPIPINPESARGPVHILSLRDCHCRAVLEMRGADKLAMFCGEPKAEGSSYCPFHHGLFIQPPKESPHGKASDGH